MLNWPQSKTKNRLHRTGNRSVAVPASEHGEWHPRHWELASCLQLSFAPGRASPANRLERGDPKINDPDADPDPEKSRAQKDARTCKPTNFSRRPAHSAAALPALRYPRSAW